MLLFSQKKHRDYLEAWEKAMATGLMTGRPFSKHTSSQYVRYIEPFLRQYGSVSLDNLKTELSNIPAAQFSKRNSVFRAVVSFAKYLIQENALNPAFLEKAKPYKPKRHLPAKRLTVKETDIQRLIAATKNPLDRLILILLACTGLRASEACDLRLEDIDFEDRRLKVRCGKWGKERKVGIGDGLLGALQNYLKTRPGLTPSDFLLRNGVGLPLDRSGLYQRLEKLGLRVDVKVTPHALRRAFVTINVRNGVPLVYLQIACGHREITTTRSYCQTSEDEVIEAMKTSFTNFS
jgi:integrase/recombinase XerD